jgi:hypothetical protein
MAYNESHVCDVALSPTRAKGHLAERRAAAPRSPRRPKGAPMHIRAVIRRCAKVRSYILISTKDIVIGMYWLPHSRLHFGVSLQTVQSVNDAISFSLPSRRLQRSLNAEVPFDLFLEQV